MTYRITVNPLPTATVTPSDNSVCLGEAASVTFAGSRGTAPYTFTYRINTGSPKTVQTVSGNSVSVITSYSIHYTKLYDIIAGHFGIWILFFVHKR